MVSTKKNRENFAFILEMEGHETARILAEV
jgi:hypothetical protein